MPNGIWLPIIERPGGVCVEGRLQVTVFDTFYSFQLTPDGNVKTIRPLPWQSPTLFRLVNYSGPVIWTQYQPVYFKQVNGYEFTYPGGRSGETFRLWVETACGIIVVQTDIDDPTPTPTPRPAATATPTPAASQANKIYLPALNRDRP